MDGMKTLLAHYPWLYVNAHRTRSLARWAARRAHEPEFKFYRHAPFQPGRVFLDVGASNGMSALSFRLYDRQTPIVSIEPNEALERDLKLVSRLIPGFEYRLMAAGEKAGESTLFTPCYRGTPLTGEASLDRPDPDDVWWIRENVKDLKVGDFSVLEQRVEVVPLDELDLAPAHVKVDVEGRELEVLKGMRETLSSCRPTILLERSSRFPELCDWLVALGYRPIMTGQNALFLADGVLPGLGSYPSGSTSALFGAKRSTHTPS